jgi:hypothetical protein
MIPSHKPQPSTSYAGQNLLAESTQLLHLGKAPALSQDHDPDNPDNLDNPNDLLMQIQDDGSLYDPGIDLCHLPNPADIGLHWDMEQKVV